MSRRRRDEWLPRIRLPGVRSASCTPRQTDQAIPVAATMWPRRLRPLPRPDAFDPPTQSPCPPRWCPFISPGFGATIRLRGPTKHVLHTPYYGTTPGLHTNQAHTQHKPNAAHTTTTQPNLEEPRPLDDHNQKTGSHHRSMPYQSKITPTPPQLPRRITAAGDAQRTLSSQSFLVQNW